MDRKPLATLDQRYGLWSRQELELFDDEVKVHFRTGPNESRRTVPLDVFDTNDTEGRIFPSWASWGFKIGILALAAGGGLALAQRIETGASPAWAGWIASAGAAVAALSAVLWRALAYDAWYFYHAFTGDFLCAIVHGSPDAAAARGFFEQLKAQARKRFEQSKEEAEMPSVARELRALHELRERKVISEEEFAQKKQELLDDLMRD
jgi:hypothetical protein